MGRARIGPFIHTPTRADALPIRDSWVMRVHPAVQPPNLIQGARLQAVFEACANIEGGYESVDSLRGVCEQGVVVHEGVAIREASGIGKVGKCCRRARIRRSDTGKDGEGVAVLRMEWGGRIGRVGIGVYSGIPEIGVYRCGDQGRAFEPASRVSSIAGSITDGH